MDRKEKNNREEIRSLKIRLEILESRLDSQNERILEVEGDCNGMITYIAKKGTIEVRAFMMEQKKKG